MFELKHPAREGMQVYTHEIRLVSAPCNTSETACSQSNCLHLLEFHYDYDQVLLRGPLLCSFFERALPSSTSNPFTRHLKLLCICSFAIHTASKMLKPIICISPLLISSDNLLIWFGSLFSLTSCLTVCKIGPSGWGNEF